MSDTTSNPPVPSQKIVFILLAIASLSTTALIVLTIVYQRLAPPAQTPPPQYGGMMFHAEPANPTAPQVMFPAPAFELTQRDESRVSLDGLKGKIWVGNFFFTRCVGICPMMTVGMADLQADLQSLPQWDDIRLVSFSVDPEHDTPEVLREYAQQYDADDTHWLFLTGERQAMWQMVGDGFKLAVSELDNPAMPILHSDKFVLVDQAGQIRGYYECINKEGRDELIRDLQLLLRESTASASVATGK